MVPCARVERDGGLRLPDERREDLAVRVERGGGLRLPDAEGGVTG